MTPGPGGALRLRRQRPEPGRVWIRYAPRSWPAPDRPWSDLAAGRLRWGGTGGPVPAAPEDPLDDVVYLPPVPAAAAAERHLLAGWIGATGAPVLLQLRPGEEAAVPGALPIYDLLEALMAGDLHALEGLPPRSACVWPLLPGLTDARKLQEEGLRRLARAGASCVQPLVLDLSPRQRRRLAEHADGEAFGSLFHGRPPRERDFSRLAWCQGLRPFLERPLPRPPGRRRANRRLAGLAGLAGELWLRLERPATAGQALYRLARWIDASEHDVAALAREGNLGVVPGLGEMGRRLVKEAASGRTPALVEELQGEYLGVGERLGR